MSSVPALAASWRGPAVFIYCLNICTSLEQKSANNLFRAGTRTVVSRRPAIVIYRLDIRAFLEEELANSVLRGSASSVVERRPAIVTLDISGVQQIPVQAVQS